MSIIRRLLVAGIVFIIAVPPAASATHEVLPPLQVSIDPVDDGVLLADLQPEYIDIVAAYIAEDAQHLIFTWEMAEINDVTGPAIDAQYWWEFALDDQDGLDDPVTFALSVAKTRGSWRADLDKNCRIVGGELTCDDVSATIDVTEDYAANTVTAKVKRNVLRDANNVRIASLDGTILTEVDIFVGIAALQGVVATAFNNVTDDVADLTELEEGMYILGR